MKTEIGNFIVSQLKTLYLKCNTCSLTRPRFTLLLSTPIWLSNLIIHRKKCYTITLLKTVGMGFKCDHSERKYHLKGISHPIHLTRELDNTHTILVHQLFSKISLSCQAWKRHEGQILVAIQVIFLYSVFILLPTPACNVVTVMVCG